MNYLKLFFIMILIVSKTNIALAQTHYLLMPVPKDLSSQLVDYSEQEGDLREDLARQGIDLEVIHPESNVKIPQDSIVYVVGHGSGDVDFYGESSKTGLTGKVRKVDYAASKRQWEIGQLSGYYRIEEDPVKNGEMFSGARIWWLDADNDTGTKNFIDYMDSKVEGELKDFEGSLELRACQCPSIPTKLVKTGRFHEDFQVSALQSYVNLTRPAVTYEEKFFSALHNSATSLETEVTIHRPKGQVGPVFWAREKTTYDDDKGLAHTVYAPVEDFYVTVFGDNKLLNGTERNEGPGPNSDWDEDKYVSDHLSGAEYLKDEISFDDLAYFLLSAPDSSADSLDLSKIGFDSIQLRTGERGKRVEILYNPDTPEEPKKWGMFKRFDDESRTKYKYVFFNKTDRFNSSNDNLRFRVGSCF